MTYESKVSQARTALEAFNASSTSKVDIDLFFKKLAESGGTSEDNLSEATWEDLEDCGLPRILARKISKIFRGPSESPKVIIENSDPRTAALQMLPADLIAKYDPNQPKHPIAERLKELSNNSKFIFLTVNGYFNFRSNSNNSSHLFCWIFN